jgi:hypothetical protein
MFFILSFMSFLLQNLRAGGQKRLEGLALAEVGEVAGREWGRWRGKE